MPPTPDRVVLPQSRGVVVVSGHIEFADGRKVEDKANAKAVLRDMQTQLYGETCDTSWDIIDIDSLSNTVLIRGLTQTMEQLRATCMLVGVYKEAPLRVDIDRVQRNPSQLRVLVPELASAGVP